MMPTDTERREIAARLREIRPCKSGHIKWWEIARALGLKQPAGWFGWEKFEPDSVNRLADLIDPDTTTDTTKSPELTTKCDRDALLALADECGDASRAYAGDGHELTSMQLANVSRRIREALGVES